MYAFRKRFEWYLTDSKHNSRKLGMIVVWCLGSF